MDNGKILDDLFQLTNQHGISIPELFTMLNKSNFRFMQMSDANHKVFSDLYDEIFKPSLTTKEKGKKLEDLTEVLFINSFPNMFKVRRNSRTSTNEIDLLISWTQTADSMGINREFRDLGNTFLCECKNYTGKVNVTYIGKFSSLLSCSDTKLGIMVAWEGVTGKGWTYGSGLIKKIALSEKRYILVITQKDLQQIYTKEINLFTLLEDKYQALKQDICYEEYIQEHELQDEWKTDC